MVGISYDGGSLIAVFVDAILYGAFTALFGMSIYLSIRREQLYPPPRTGRNSIRVSHYMTPMFIAGLFLYLWITAHWIFTVVSSIDAFIIYGGRDGHYQPPGFQSDATQVVFLIQTLTLMATLVTGDTVMVYRLWRVWHPRRGVMIFPLMTLLGLIVSCAFLIHSIVLFPVGAVGELALDEWGKPILVVYAFTISTTFYCTGMIGWRVWKVNGSPTGRTTGDHLMHFLAVFIESAAMYSAWELMFVVCYELQNLSTIMFIIGPAMVGISFTLLSVRVHLRWIHEHDTSQIMSRSQDNVDPAPQSFSFHSTIRSRI